MKATMRSISIVRSVAPFFRIKGTQATSIVERIADVVREWRDIAQSLEVRRSEQDEMADAFTMRQSA